MLEQCCHSVSWTMIMNWERVYTLWLKKKVNEHNGIVIIRYLYLQSITLIYVFNVFPGIIFEGYNFFNVNDLIDLLNRSLNDHLKVLKSKSVSNGFTKNVYILLLSIVAVLTGYQVPTHSHTPTPYRPEIWREIWEFGFFFFLFWSTGALIKVFTKFEFVWKILQVDEVTCVQFIF